METPNDIREKAEILGNIVGGEVGKTVTEALVVMYQIGCSQGFADGLQRGTEIAVKTQQVVFGALGL